MADVLVSVIMPVYNREDTIKRAVDSVLFQTYVHFELIIVDDGSKDNTVSVIKAYKDDRIRLICQEHGGANRARNIGIANARGKYIAFQDSDDEWCKNKLAIQVEFMQTKGYLACFSPYSLHEGERMYVVPGDYQTNKKYHNDLISILKCHNVVGTPTLIFDKEVVSLLKGEVFDESLPRFQEYELLIRLVQMVDIGYIEEPLVNAYRHETSIAKSRISLYEAVGRILRKHGNFLDVRLFLDTYIIKSVEYEKISELLEGIEILRSIAGTELVDFNTEIIKYLHDRLRYRNLAFGKLYQAKRATLLDKKFVIYGTGVVANEFYKTISGMGIKPDSFIVTSTGESEPKTIDDILVRTAEDYRSKDVLVMVCVSDKYQADILDNLIRLGYSDICIYNTL